jgi:hypothetical protein
VRQVRAPTCSLVDQSTPGKGGPYSRGSLMLKSRMFEQGYSKDRAEGKLYPGVTEMP